MSPSFDLASPDHFTAGAIGPPGERVFYLQGRQDRTVVTLRSEKEQVRALAHYLEGLLPRVPDEGEAPPADTALLEPVDAAWLVASIAVGYDAQRRRIVVVANELVEEENVEPASARFAITRAQAATFVKRAEALARAGRPVCFVCSQPKDPAGHVCPRSNGHAVP
ncbi:MAG: DUF3090 domain-containing protein [Candidatus Rokuibacteriota bacterium]|nr:MAG: DUF3090 domain-containing protein [Candidatus Rokubacteria bacterium]PYN63179.1 MAG: DUF3090 domain-containing protein [Candidatus Rokubacteria bacterium]